MRALEVALANPSFYAPVQKALGIEQILITMECMAGAVAGEVVVYLQLEDATERSRQKAHSHLRWKRA